MYESSFTSQKNLEVCANAKHQDKDEYHSALEMTDDEKRTVALGTRQIETQKFENNKKRLRTTTHA